MLKDKKRRNIRFSIITPSYNQGAFIESNILSVLNQNYKNYEHIIIDGESTDNTIAILKKYNHLIWISEKDNGQSDALNKGFKMATGEIICWINSDDELSAKALQTGANYFYANPDKNSVSGTLEIINSKGERVNVLKSKMFTFNYLLNQDKRLHQPSIFFRKSLFEKIGYINDKLQYAMDYDFFLRVTQISPIDNIPQTLARYRQHSMTKTQTCTLNMVLEQKKVRNLYRGKKFCSASLQIEQNILRNRIKKIINYLAASYGVST